MTTKSPTDAHVHQPPEQNSEDRNSVSPKPKAPSHSSVVVSGDSSESAVQPPLDDPTQFTTRSFAMVWNEGHSIRLINREGRGAISIPWDEISALRALLKGTCPVGGGEV